MPNLTKEDWKKAEAHLKSVEEAYRSCLGLPGVNIGFAMRFIDEARSKFNQGDRSGELYAEIMTFDV